MDMHLAAAYSGPPAWTFGRVFSSWHLEPAVLAIAVLGTAGYLVGVSRLRRAGTDWRKDAAFTGFSPRKRVFGPNV